MGPASLSREVPFGAQVVFVRGGALIPLLDPRTETLSPVAPEQVEAGLMSRVVTPGSLTWLIAAEGAAHEAYVFRNHDGATISFEELDGGRGRAALSPAREGVALPPHSALQIDLRSDSAAPSPEQVRLNGDELPWVESEEGWVACQACLWRPRAGRLLIKLGAHGGADQLVEW